MKKIVTVILCIMGVLCATANPLYMSSARNYSSSCYSSGGISRAPVARMTSTSRMLNYNPSNPSASFEKVRGITTSASNVYGGISAGETYSRMYSSSRRGPKPTPTSPDDPGVCEHCHWVLDENGDYYCDVCKVYLYDGCQHEEEYGYCWCPVECDWKAILFLSALAGWYAMHKVRSGKKGNKNELIAVL